MATIKFTSPLTKYASKNPWFFDKKYFEDIPPIPGVYIVGVKIPVNGQGEKFCPLYIGTYKENIKTRIRGHWDENNTNIVQGALNSYKELFDLELDPSLFYEDIELWNQLWKGKNNTNTNKVNLFNEISINGNNSLIWFPDELFFQTYLKNAHVHLNPASNWHNNTVNPSILTNVNLKNKIVKVKNVITSKFWFAYAEVNDNTALTLIEANVNLKLRNSLRLPTYAKSNNPRENINIDLSDIQDELVNMTSAKFTSPLILK
jgi:hypothetical protein